MPSPIFPQRRVDIPMSVETILYNAKVATNGVPSFVEAVAVTDGKIAAVGTNDEVMRLRGPRTRVIDARRRTLIPGLNDSHMHPIRGGLNYNLELRWDGVPSLADALRMLKDQVSSDAGAAVGPRHRRVERISVRRASPADARRDNAAAPETPVFAMHLHDRALLNGRLRALG